MANFSEIMLGEFNSFLKERNVNIANFEKVDLEEDIPLYGTDAEWIKAKVQEYIDIDWLILSLNDFENGIIEILEELLEEEGIVIANTEKYDAIENGLSSAEEIANIYGSDYGELQSAIEDAIADAEDMEKYRKAFNTRDLEFEEHEDYER